MSTHPSTQHVLDLFDFGPMSQENMELLGLVRDHFGQFAGFLVEILPDQPEVTVALRELMDAKNWAGLAIVAEDKKEKAS